MLKAEAVQIILTGIDNDIYSTVDACPNACEMWKAIERLKQGESINVQDLETNLYWEFGKFTSEPATVTEDRKMSKELEIVKTSWLYKQGRKLGFSDAEQVIGRMITDDESKDRNWKAHYVQNNYDNYMCLPWKIVNIPEQPESSNDIYLTEQGDSNITIDSLDICYDRAQDDQDETDDLDQERDLLASLIQETKYVKLMNSLICNVIIVENWGKNHEHLEKELSKSRTMSKSFEALQKHAINLELDLQQCKEKIKNDKSFKENQSNVFLKEREQYYEIQDLKA
ncbi:hypothetical protein Tco_1227032 [Tanacetum coccineum]